MYSIVKSPYLFSTYSVNVRIILYMYAKIISIDAQYPNSYYTMMPNDGQYMLNEVGTSTY